MRQIFWKTGGILWRIWPNGGVPDSMYWIQPLASSGLFAGSYFALRLVGSLHSIASSAGAFCSRPLRQEWWGLKAHPAASQWVMFLMTLDLIVFLDYGH
jgi:hypothetical protein